MKEIPSHYRQLSANEIIRKGDICKSNGGDIIKPVNGSIGDYPSDWGNWTFWRRRHVKKSSAPVTVAAPAKTDGKTVTVVQFSYPHNGITLPRTVQIINMDNRYLSGLEITTQSGKYKYQFKRYLLNKITTHIKLVHFGQPLS